MIISIYKCWIKEWSRVNTCLSHTHFFDTHWRMKIDDGRGSCIYIWYTVENNGFQRNLTLHIMLIWIWALRPIIGLPTTPIANACKRSCTLALFHTYYISLCILPVQLKLREFVFKLRSGNNRRFVSVFIGSSSWMKFSTSNYSKSCKKIVVYSYAVEVFWPCKNSSISYMTLSPFTVRSGSIEMWRLFEHHCCSAWKYV